MALWTTSIYQWEGDTTQRYGTYDWWSREVLIPAQAKVGCARVVFESNDLSSYWAEVAARQDIVDRNMQKIAERAMDMAGINIDHSGFSYAEYPIAGDALEEVPAEITYSGADSLTFYYYANGVLKLTKTITNMKPFRLPGGFRARFRSYRIVSNVTVKEVALASSMEELKLENKREG